VARADSTIRVNILGDAKSLQKAAGKSEGAIGGLNKKVLAVGGVIAGAFAADQVIDFANTAVKEADRVADATSRLTDQLGSELAQNLIDRADDFTDLGASRGDMLELETRIADIGTAAGLSDDKLAPFAESAAEAASAMALSDPSGRDAAYWIDLIGKAAAGSERPLRDLGVNMDDATVEARALRDTGKGSADELTRNELAAARAAIIMEQLAPRVNAVADGDADLEQKQAAVNAKWETLTGEIGGPLTSLLEEVLDFVLRGVEGWGLLSERIGGFDDAISDALTPVARMIDLQRTLIGVLGEAIRLLGEFFDTAGDTTTTFGGRAGPRAPGIGGTVNRVTVNVQGGSPETIEQAVRNATRTTARRG
jgi:hypothetical protein